MQEKFPEIKKESVQHYSIGQKIRSENLDGSFCESEIVNIIDSQKVITDIRQENTWKSSSLSP